MNLTRPILLAALALAPSCATPHPAPAEQLGLQAHLEEGLIRCRNTDPEREVRFLTYQRDGDEEAYGVYGLYDAKSAMGVPRPLDGGAIAWDGVAPVAGLERVISTTGLDSKEARALIEQHGATWFDDGLRVFFACSGEPPEGDAFASATWPVVVVDLE